VIFAPRGGPDKKVCGILTEMSAESDRVHFVVLGIGINVNSASKELPPGSISLKEIAGREISRLDLARRLLKEIESDYSRLKKGRFTELAEEWERFSATTGRAVTATLLDRKVHGEATGIDRDGALWIRKENGLQERILSGDIQHMRRAESRA
jgi:BirA family biotin operon repressor/biotin-[acetyl-CoA-carboxylase] ligase